MKLFYKKNKKNSHGTNKAIFLFYRDGGSLNRKYKKKEEAKLFNFKSFFDSSEYSRIKWRDAKICNVLEVPLLTFKLPTFSYCPQIV